MEGGKSLGGELAFTRRGRGGQARFLSDGQAGLEGKRVSAEGQAGSQVRVASWERAGAPDVPWGGAREGERNGVPGTRRQWRW